MGRAGPPLVDRLSGCPGNGVETTPLQALLHRGNVKFISDLSIYPLDSGHSYPQTPRALPATQADHQRPEQAPRWASQHPVFSPCARESSSQVKVLYEFGVLCMVMTL